MYFYQLCRSYLNQIIIMKKQSMIKKKDNQYQQFLLNQLKETHTQFHVIENQLENQRKKNAKLLKEISGLRKKQNDNKLQIKTMGEKIQELEFSINAIKKPHPRKPQIQKVNISKINKQHQKIQTTPKQAFKQFLTDNFPKYKNTVKKVIALILYFERHWMKSDRQRISSYHNIIGAGINKLLQYILPSPSSLSAVSSPNINNSNQGNVAASLIKQWKGSQSKMKELMYQRNRYKIKEDEYLQKIQQLESTEAKLLINKKMLEAKNYSYQFSLKAKAAQFVPHIKKLLLEKNKIVHDDDVEQENIKKYQQDLERILKVMSQVTAKKQTQKSDNNIQPLNESLNHNKDKISSNKFLITNHSGKSTMKTKVGPTAAIVKKNIFGYYEEPQLNNNKPTLYKTVPHQLSVNKSIQTTPQDLRIITRFPILMLNIIDGKIRNIQNRHRLDFYVRVCSIEPEKLIASQYKESIKFANKKYVDTVVKQGLDPVWNQKLLIKDYTFPFLYLQLMNMSKLSLKDDCAGIGKLQVTQTSTVKQLLVRNDQKQYQGKIRFELSYPKCPVYLFTVNSIELIYPDSVKFLNETLVLDFPFNPKSKIQFAIGQKIKYLGGETYDKSTRYYQGNQFLVMPAYHDDQVQNALKVKLLQNKKIGAKPIVEQSLWTQQNTNDSQINKIIRIKIKGHQDWEVVLQGTVLTIISETDEPQKIEEETDELMDESSRRYFSVLAAYPILNLNYGSLSLDSHIKLPLIFKYLDSENTLNIRKLIDNKQQEESVEPIVQNQNTISFQALQKIGASAPKIVYKIYIKTIEAPSQILITTNFYYYQKFIDKLELCYINNLDKQQQNNIQTLRDNLKNVKNKKDIRKFTIFTKQLVQNYYVTISKMFGKQQFIRFKIGYVRYENLLKMPGFQDKNYEDHEIHDDQQSQKIQQEQSADGAFVTVHIKNGKFSSFTGTSNYQLIFIPKSSEDTQDDAINILDRKIISTVSKSVDGWPTWDQKIILPYRKLLTLHVVEHNMFNSEKIIYQQQDFQIGALQLKLNKLFINIVKNVDQQLKINGDYIFIGSIQQLPSLYKLKVNQIHAEIDEEADWIGQIDPYIRFHDPYMSKNIYQTKKLDGAGNSPTWTNDQFQSIVGLGKFQCALYDSDIIGKDDYLGISYLNIETELENKYNKNSDYKINIQKNNSYYVKQLFTPIRKNQKQCGNLQLTGQFRRIGGKNINKTVNLSDFEVYGYPSKYNAVQAYRINIFAVHLNHKYMDSSSAYLQFIDSRTQIYNKKSFNFNLEGRPLVDFQIWPKFFSLQKKDLINNVKLLLHRKHKTLFSQNDQVIGQCIFSIPEQQNGKSIKFAKAEINLYSEKQQKDLDQYIGDIYYLIEEVSSIKYLVVEGQSILQIQQQKDNDYQSGETYSNRHAGGCLLVSDIGDTLLIGNQFLKSKPNQNIPRVIFYKDTWDAIHPNNKQNSNYMFRVQKQSQNTYGTIFNIVQHQYSTLYGAILAHQFEYTHEISHKNNKKAINSNQLQTQNYQMTHLYFSPMQQRLMNKIGFNSDEDAQSKRIQQLKDIYLIFQIDEKPQKSDSAQKLQISQSKIQVSLVSLLNYQKMQGNSKNSQNNNKFYLSLPLFKKKEEDDNQVKQSVSVKLQVCQIIKQSNKTIKNVIESSSKMLLNINQQNQLNKTKILTIGKCIKYNGLKYLFSCQLTKIITTTKSSKSNKPSNINIKRLKQLWLPWIYLQIFPEMPYRDYKKINNIIKKLHNAHNQIIFSAQIQDQNQNDDNNNNNNNKWKYQLCVPSYYDDQNQSNILKKQMESILDRNQQISGQQQSNKRLALITNRSIYLSNIHIPVPEAIYNGNNQITIKLSISVRDKQNKNVSTLQNQVLQIAVNTTTNSTCITQSRKQLTAEQNQQDKYYAILNYHNYSIHGEYKILQKQIQYKQEQKTTQMQIIKLEQILISFSPSAANQFHSVLFEQFIQLHFIEPKSNCKTICRLSINQNIQSKSSKQFLFVNVKQTSPTSNVLILPDYQYLKDDPSKNKQEQVEIQVWSGKKNKMLSFMNKSQLLGKALVSFDHHRPNQYANVVIQLKDGIKNKITIGKLIIRYQYQYQSSDIDKRCEELYIDRIVTQNAKQLAYNNLKIVYQINNNKTKQQIDNNNQSEEQSEEQSQSTFKHIVQAIPLNSILGKSSEQKIYNNMSIYKFPVPIMISYFTNLVEIKIYRYSVMSEKQTLVCRIKSLKQISDLLYGEQNNRKHYQNVGRWSNQIKSGKVSKMIVGGSKSSILSLPPNSGQGKVKQAKDTEYIQLTLHNLYHLCPQKSKVTIAIQNANATIQTKSLDFKSQSDFTCSFVLNKEHCDFLRIHILGEKKKQILYTSQEIDFMKDTGVIGFYVGYTAKDYAAIFVGTCVWSIRDISHLYFNSQMLINSALQSLNILGNINQGQGNKHYIIQLTRVSLELFIDTEYFSEMNPFLQINDFYSTTIGIGREQIFWKLGFAFPVFSLADTIKLEVKDQDMFYDDYIGTATMKISDIISQFEKDILENLNASEQRRMDIPVWDQAKQSRQTGHIKLHYQIIQLNQAKQPKKQPSIQIMKVLMKLDTKLLLKYFEDNHPKIYKNFINQDNEIKQKIILDIQQVLQKQTKNRQKLGSSVMKILLDAIKTFEGNKMVMDNIWVPICYQSSNKQELEPEQITKMLSFISRKSMVFSTITDNKQYSKKPLSIQLNLPDFARQLQVCPIYQISPQNSSNKLKQLITLNDIKLVFHRPKINKIGNNVRVSILTQYTSCVIFPTLKGDKSKISSSKTSPQFIKLNLQQQESENTTANDQIIITVLNPNIKPSKKKPIKQKQQQNNNQQITSIVIDDTDTGFTCKFSISAKDLKTFSNKQIVVSQVYDNYKGSNRNEDIGLVYLQLSNNTIEKQIQFLKEGIQRLPIEKLTKQYLLNNYKNIGRNSTEIRHIKILLKNASLYKDIQILGKMDPYCKIYIRNHLTKQFKLIYTTRTQENKGTNPIWNQQFYLETQISDKPIELYFKIMDEEITINRGVADGYLQLNGNNQIDSLSGEVKNQKILVYEPSEKFLSLGELKKSQEKGKLFVRIWCQNPIYIVFTDISYFDQEHLRKKDKVYMHSLSSDLKQKYSTEVGHQVNQVQLQSKYPLLITDKILFSIHLNLEKAYTQNSQYNVEKLVDKCGKCENTIICNGVTLNYFIFI